jgi:hypothetical protein
MLPSSIFTAVAVVPGNFTRFTPVAASDGFKEKPLKTNNS